MIKHLISILATGLLIIAVLPGQASAQCQNCLGEGGSVEDCDDDHGAYGFEDCDLILGFYCAGDERCEIGLVDALDLGLDGLKRRQLPASSIATGLASTWPVLETGSSGPTAHPGQQPLALRSRRDCSGAIRGVLRTMDELSAIRDETDLIAF